MISMIHNLRHVYSMKESSFPEKLEEGQSGYLIFCLGCHSAIGRTKILDIDGHILTIKVWERDQDFIIRSLNLKDLNVSWKFTEKVVYPKESMGIKEMVESVYEVISPYESDQEVMQSDAFRASSRDRFMVDSGASENRLRELKGAEDGKRT